MCLLLAAAMALSLVVGVTLWVSLGQPKLVTGGPLDAKDRFEGVKLILAVVGGVGAVVALTIAYRRQRHSETAEYREDLKLFTERFGKAAEQLGHDQPATRIAGIYAMTRLADDAHDSDARQLCINVLCGYLRLPYEPDPQESGHRPGEHIVRHTVLRVIRDHLRPGFSSASWCGHNFNLSGAVFDGVDFTDIRLTGGHMSFHEARFLPGTFYFSALVDKAHVWFTKTRFEGADVRFEGARLVSGGVHFDGAEFSGGRMTLRDVEAAPGVLDLRGAQVVGTAVDWGNVSPPVVASSTPTP